MTFQMFRLDLKSEEVCFSHLHHHHGTSLGCDFNQICVFLWPAHLRCLVVICIVGLPELRLEKFIGAFGAPASVGVERVTVRWHGRKCAIVNQQLSAIAAAGIP